MLMYGSDTSARTPKRQVGTLAPTLGLEGLRDLLMAVYLELEMLGPWPGLCGRELVAAIQEWEARQ